MVRAATRILPPQGVAVVSGCWGGMSGGYQTCVQPEAVFAIFFIAASAQQLCATAIFYLQTRPKIRGLPRDVSPPNLGSLSGICPPLGCGGVQYGPGATALTRMPRAALCLASDLVKRTMADLVITQLRRTAKDDAARKAHKAEQIRRGEVCNVLGYAVSAPLEYKGTQ